MTDQEAALVAIAERLEALQIPYILEPRIQDLSDTLERPDIRVNYQNWFREGGGK